MQKVDSICCSASEMGKIMANKCIKRGVDLSTVKLQKLLIIAHGALLVSYGRPLFFEGVSLMKHGVAIKEVDEDFRYEIKYNQEFIPYISLLDCQNRVMDEVIKRYGNMDSFELNNLKALKSVEKFLDAGECSIAEVNGAIMKTFEDNYVATKLKFEKELGR